MCSLRWEGVKSSNLRSASNTHLEPLSSTTVSDLTLNNDLESTCVISPWTVSATNASEP